MKILFLTRRFYPDIGGVEKHVEEIANVLVKRKHKIIVICESEGNRKSREMTKRVEVFRIKIKNEKKKKWEIWRWFWKNRRLIQEADVIHAHDVAFWYFPFKFIYPKKKFFVTFHGYESYPLRQGAIKSRRLAEKLSSGNIIVGDFIKKWYGTKPDYVIYGGASIPKQQTSAKNKKSAIFVGRLDDQTGIMTYADAAREIKKDIKDFSLKIVGDGKYAARLLDFKQVGFQEDVQKYYQGSNIAFVSRYLAILEAMANKRLVFAVYDNPIKEDYLKMSPFWNKIIISDESKDLANKVKHYLRNQKEADEIIEQAFGWVKENSWEKVAETYLKLWNKQNLVANTSTD